MSTHKFVDNSQEVAKESPEKWPPPTKISQIINLKQFTSVTEDEPVVNLKNCVGISETTVQAEVEMNPYIDHAESSKEYSAMDYFSSNFSRCINKISRVEEVPFPPDQKRSCENAAEVDEINIEIVNEDPPHCEVITSPILVSRGKETISFISESNKRDCERIDVRINRETVAVGSTSQNDQFISFRSPKNNCNEKESSTTSKLFVDDAGTNLRQEPNDGNNYRDDFDPRSKVSVGAENSHLINQLDDNVPEYKETDDENEEQEEMDKCELNSLGRELNVTINDTLIPENCLTEKMDEPFSPIYEMPSDHSFETNVIQLQSRASPHQSDTATLPDLDSPDILSIFAKSSNAKKMRNGHHQYLSEDEVEPDIDEENSSSDDCLDILSLSAKSSNAKKRRNGHHQYLSEDEVEPDIDEENGSSDDDGLEEEQAACGMIDNQDDHDEFENYIGNDQNHFSVDNMDPAKHSVYVKDVIPKSGTSNVSLHKISEKYNKINVNIEQTYNSEDEFDADSHEKIKKAQRARVNTPRNNSRGVKGLEKNVEGNCMKNNFKKSYRSNFADIIKSDLNKRKINQPKDSRKPTASNKLAKFSNSSPKFKDKKETSKTPFFNKKNKKLGLSIKKVGMMQNFYTKCMNKKFSIELIVLICNGLF